MFNSKKSGTAVLSEGQSYRTLKHLTVSLVCIIPSV